MLSERQHHQALEIKHNVRALDPIELLRFANDSKVPQKHVRAHLIESAMLAKWAHDESDDTPDLVFKIIETEFLNRAQY